MTAQKPRSIHEIEERMENLSPASFRYRVLDAARGFKSSWIELGQHLFGVYKDKMYREWGYLTFEAYCSKEIGIRQNTAVKLLKSYAFLEKEEPAFVKRELLEERKPSQIPSYESVNTLRLAKDNKKLTGSDYEKLREDVLENVKEDSEVKQKIRYILKASPRSASSEDPKRTALKKLSLTLKNSKNDLSLAAAPVKVLKKIDELLELVEDYLK